MSDQNLLDLLGGDEAGSPAQEKGKNPPGPQKPKAPEPPKAKKKPGEKKTAAPAAKQPKPPEPKRYGRLTLLVYGNRLELPREGMTEGEVFEFLSADYPEHTRDHSQLVEDEERGFLIPVLKGHRKGTAAPARELSFWDRVPPDPVCRLRPVERFLGSDGLYEMRRTQAGTFVGLRLGEERLRPFFRLSVPKVPVEVLLEAVSVLTRDPRNEALVNVVYDGGKMEHSVEIPDQDRFVGAVAASSMVEDDRRFRVVQMHSHGTTRAFFSATDDHDELGHVGLYGVIGRCDRERPEALFRFACASTLAAADPYEIFDAAPGELERHLSLPHRR
jgi:hypothetical protein